MPDPGKRTNIVEDCAVPARPSGGVPQFAATKRVRALTTARKRLQYRREREVRRFAALAGTIAATAFAGIAATPATAGALAMPARLSGSVVATWHGDPARGCAAAGVCEREGRPPTGPASTAG